MNTIAEITGADVTASNDRTGNEALGGDWELEYQTGDIETDVAFSADLQVEWDGTLATYSVDNTNDMGVGSLHQAILDANANVGVTDTIVFGIGSGPQVIALTTALPTILDPVNIDATTQPGFTADPVIEVDGVGSPVVTPSHPN